jgi:hypothetical protein
VPVMECVGENVSDKFARFVQNYDDVANKMV